MPNIHGVLTPWMRTPSIAYESVGTKGLNPEALSLGPREHVEGASHQDDQESHRSGKPLPACKLQSVALKPLPDAPVPWSRLAGAPGAKITQGTE